VGVQDADAQLAVVGQAFVGRRELLGGGQVEGVAFLRPVHPDQQDAAVTVEGDALAHRNLLRPDLHPPPGSRRTAGTLLSGRGRSARGSGTSGRPEPGSGAQSLPQFLPEGLEPE
jgi:hypothetical protein